MIRKSLYLLSLLLCATLAQGCSHNGPEEDGPDSGKKEEVAIDWNQAAESSTQSLVLHFWNPGRGYFNWDVDKTDGPDKDWSYWPEAHAMDVIIDGFHRSGGSNAYKYYFNKWYEGVKSKSGGSYYNNFYDDMEWICLTMIRLYEASGEAKYLATARDLWNDIQKGWNTQGGGGIAWKKDQTWSKNACSNGPGGLIAARLYRIDKKEEDLQWARKIFEWEYDHLVDAATGRVNDNLDARTGNITDWCFTYNQGTFMGLAHELYQLTGERMFLNIAVKVASYTIGGGACTDTNTGLLRSEGNGDGGLFKGIFIRYFVKLALEEDLTNGERNKFAFTLKKNAEALWKCGIDTTDPLFGPNWARTGETVDLGTHTSGATLIEAMALYETKTK